MGSSLRLAGSGALAASVVLHGLLLATGAWLLSRSLSRRRPARALPHAIEVTLTGARVELPKMSLGGAARGPDPRPPMKPARVATGGGWRTARPDTGRRGRGGRERVQAALNLADQDDGLTLNRDPLNRLDRSQIQRLATSRSRRTRDDRRATPHPMQLTFLASGDGALPVRRTPARSDPALGSAQGSTHPSKLGATSGGPAAARGAGSEPPPGARSRGKAHAVAALGAAAVVPGSVFRRSANVMLARPWVRRSRAAVPARLRGRPSDNVDSDQAVASAVESLVQASTAGSRRTGSGPGGETGGGPTGSGGEHGPGSHSTAAGSGPGPLRDVGRSAGALGYFDSMQAKLEPYWRHAFPIWAIAEGRGGVAIVAVTLSPAGKVLGVSLVRPSGVSEFDHNVMAAVQRAGSFGPVPPVFGRRPLRVEITFDALNPVVGRAGPGPGHYR